MDGFERSEDALAFLEKHGATIDATLRSSPVDLDPSDVLDAFRVELAGRLKALVDAKQEVALVQLERTLWAQISNGRRSELGSALKEAEVQQKDVATKLRLSRAQERVLKIEADPDVRAAVLLLRQLNDADRSGDSSV